MLGALLDGTTAPDVFVWRGRHDRDLDAEARQAGWTVIGLDTREVTSSTQFYDSLVRDWQLPEWFGRNLDAWWDVLAERANHGPTLMNWVGAESLAVQQPDFAAVVLGLLRDATSQAPAFAVVVRREAELDREPLLLSELDALL